MLWEVGAGHEIADSWMVPSLINEGLSARELRSELKGCGLQVSPGEARGDVHLSEYEVAQYLTVKRITADRASIP